MGICAPLALGDAEGAVGAACGAGVGLVSGLVEGGDFVAKNIPHLNRTWASSWPICFESNMGLVVAHLL